MEGGGVTFISDSAVNITSLFDEKSFDIVFFIDVLHHLVSDTWKKTRNVQMDILKKVSAILKDDGYLCVKDHPVESYLINGAASWIIYKLTASKNKMITSLCKKLDGKSAGVGVCFLSDHLWIKTFERCGFRINRKEISNKRTLKWYMRVFLLLKEYHFSGIYILKKAG